MQGDTMTATEPPEHVRILFVDDDDAVRMLVTRVLTRAGHSVAAFMDATQALEALQTASFDLAILDKNLPSMDGFTLARQVMETHPAMAVAMITAAAERLSPQDAGLLDAYLGKPFRDLAEISAVVPRAMAARRGKVARAQLNSDLEALQLSLGKS